MLDKPVVNAFSHVKPGDTPWVGEGLRDFFLYRDLGVAAATGGPAAQPGGGAPEPAVAGARGTIDDDEHLAAYNAYLARLNQPGHRPGR